MGCEAPRVGHCDAARGADKSEYLDSIGVSAKTGNRIDLSVRPMAGELLRASAFWRGAHFVLEGTQMKRRILSLLLVLALLCGLLPGAYAASGSAIWPGSGNLPGNNQVTDAPTPTQSSEIGEKWTYALNDTVDSWGAYYAGQSVIADGALFATGGGHLHRVDLETGTGTVSEDAAGTTEWVYDFLCWGDGVVFVATSTSIAAFDADTLRCLGTVDGSFGTYCPVQYHDGVVACGGWLYTYEDGTFTLL